MPVSYTHLEVYKRQSDGNVYLYSQFEVPDARRVYAVFDQPDLKATFKFSVKAPQSWTCLLYTSRCV